MLDSSTSVIELTLVKYLTNILYFKRGDTAETECDDIINGCVESEVSLKRKCILY